MTRPMDRLLAAVKSTMTLPWTSRSDRRPEVLEKGVSRPVPPPPPPTPRVLCRTCDCTNIRSQVCGDGCTGVVDQADGRCAACIDPSVIIDPATGLHAGESECVFCAALFFGARRYCSEKCESADHVDEFEWYPEPEPRTAFPVDDTVAPW
ncbi:hypothetical protein [Streptomyces griseus]|uniref:hypothetical protein n=1 Tax=Streptomyces griseus TaxID=1911 RepID=UPI0037A81E65